MAFRENMTVGNLRVQRKLMLEGSIEGLCAELGFTGKHYYVKSTTGTDGVGRGGSQTSPWASLAYAYSSDTVEAGDVIHLMENHVEPIVSAGDCTCDIAGCLIVFHGHGATKAQLNFTTLVTASIVISGEGTTLLAPKFLAGIDSLTGPISVTGANVRFLDAEYWDATSIETIDALIAIATATGLHIDGYRYISVTETADLKQSHIQLNGCDNIVLRNIDIRGDFDTGNIENVTDEVLNARFENVYLENLNDNPSPALFLDANATGSMKNVKLKIYSGTTYTSSVGKMAWDDRCEGFMGDGYAGEPLGTALGSGLEGKVDTIASDLVVTNAIVDTIASDLIVFYAAWETFETIMSDFVVKYASDVP